jgi:2-polyprenyl-3-methyl-5-hydroxy-6-metoxy-1,4-benzoquinol methylase
MEISTALRLIQKGITQTNTPQVWADLGAGKGLFTHALANLLNRGSVVYAVDRDSAALRSITTTRSEVTINKVNKDFIHDSLALPPLDGIIMANALHFVAHQRPLLRILKKNLKDAGRIILIEYDMSTASPWVPYPVSFLSLQAMLPDLGFTSATKLDEVPSVYNRANIYAALIKNQ